MKMNFSGFIGRYRISYCHTIILMTHAGDEYVKSQLSVFCHMYCLFVFILSHQHQHHYHHHCHQYYRRHHNRHQHWDSFTIIALISSTAIIRSCVIIFIVISPHKCSLMKHNLSANVPQYKLQATTELKLVTLKSLSHINLYTSCMHVYLYLSSAYPVAYKAMTLLLHSVRSAATLLASFQDCHSS